MITFAVDNTAVSKYFYQNGLPQAKQLAGKEHSSTYQQTIGLKI